MRWLPAAATLVVTIATATAARGQSDVPDAPPPAKAPPAEVATAASVADAPRPEQASGVIQPAATPTSDALLWVPRVILFVPRWAFWTVVQPVRGGMWLYERYQIRERLRQIFFNDTGTIGVYPTALFETGFGLNAGIRGFHRDLFGGGQQLRVRAGFGGRFDQIYSAVLETGGTADLRLETSYEIRGKENFFGIGNADLVETFTDPPVEPIDPQDDDTAFRTRFHQRIARVVAALDVAATPGFHIVTSGALLLREFGPSDEAESLFELDDDDDEGAQLELIYDPESVTGYTTGADLLYGEVELRYDNRRHAEWESEAMPSRGWLLAGYAGVAKGMGNDGEIGFLRYGLDLQRFIDLRNGSRVLALRAIAEGVTGSYDDVPFTDLPRLGGPLLLRGWDRDRFRDRAAGMVSAEYQWALNPKISAFAFVDAGRVWPSFEDLSLDDVRIGGGGGLQLHRRQSFLARFHLAGSEDGMFFNLSFDPVFDSRARVERK